MNAKEYNEVFSEYVENIIKEQLDKEKSNAICINVDSSTEKDIVINACAGRYKYVVMQSSAVSDKEVWCYKTDFIGEVIVELYIADISDSLRKFAFYSLLRNKLIDV